MREIKFRIWDKRQNEYIFERGACSKRLAVSLHGKVYSGKFDDVLSDNDYVIQQYTGLKDSKGKEIYEGDIVRGQFFDTDYMGDILVTCPVNWVEERACFNVGHRYWTRSSLKVIGNIMQNPELLEQ